MCILLLIHIQTILKPTSIDNGILDSLTRNIGRDCFSVRKANVCVRSIADKIVLINNCTIHPDLKIHNSYTDSWKLLQDKKIVVSPTFVLWRLFSNQTFKVGVKHKIFFTIQLPYITIKQFRKIPVAIPCALATTGDKQGRIQKSCCISGYYTNKESLEFAVEDFKYHWEPSLS